MLVAVMLAINGNTVCPILAHSLLVHFQQLDIKGNRNNKSNQRLKSII